VVAATTAAIISCLGSISTAWRGATTSEHIHVAGMVPSELLRVAEEEWPQKTPQKGTLMTLRCLSAKGNGHSWDRHPFAPWLPPYRRCWSWSPATLGTRSCAKKMLGVDGHLRLPCSSIASEAKHDPSGHIRLHSN